MTETMETRVAVLEKMVNSCTDGQRDLLKEYTKLSKENTMVAVKTEELERRLVTHSERHSSNYKDLFIRFDAFEKNISTFKGDVLRRLDTMSGRDSVLKVLFGGLIGVIGAVAIGFIKQYMGF